MQRSRLALFALVVLVALSGCTLPSSPDQFDTDREFGYVADYAHDDRFEFDDEETLTEDQLEDVKYRSMARIEVVRELKFEHDVELEVITRDEYRSERGEPVPASPFVNELWRGAFVVDGETDVNRAMDDLYGAGVQGYYANDRIVIITDDADEIRIDRSTLVHELVHALQDQHFGIDSRGETVDERRAELGLLEGDADYVPHLYDERCGEEWQCLAENALPATTDSGAGELNLGLMLSIYAPYSEGPPFVADLRERGGWDAVDAAYDDYPKSTSQLIHPDRYPDDRPADVDVPDRSSDDWEPITRDGEVRTETVGEATLFASLWANGVVDRPLTDGGTELSPYNYSHPATDGWAGDTFQAYHDTDDEERTGHVWKLAWETEADAERFADAYRDLLEAREAESVDDAAATYRISDGDPFEGAYRVTVSGDTVEIVGAPTVDDLEGIHGSTAPANETDAPLHAGLSVSLPGAPARPFGPSRAAATASADG
ncbi:Hvo_1808 family surface protein [Natronolimnohabitans sp. A-GB9]|uniref:Hvo_1808 family surface protein n=1 Tax=Natronolimnohabitans sp. A-GB9 TaxID=3069757 RepID=UPI0027B4E57C|nr:Hvo_1808 family surface protein [Natronolimnohabitans sp. A-GB9]MDQ2052347.1 Hvo_1808 family surface protein [Natronolimnohabitans sp. A-GB9]